jgi:7-cyano-7-deazaguanine synthase
MTAKAVVLLSGGLDSATSLLIARELGFDLHAISFDYGQRHAIELECARRIASAAGVRAHRVVKIDFPAAGASALTDASIPVPRHALHREPIPVTYVPARNTIFLAHAVSWGEAIAAFDIFIGANALDYSGYPDCRPEFLEAFEKTANLGTRAGSEGARFRIHAPLLRMTKAEIIRRAAALGLEFASTSSCYDPGAGGAPCGACDSCLLRARGFEEAGLVDPRCARA